MVCSPTEVCTLSLEYPLLQAHAADVVVASAARAEEPTTLLCPSFPVHSTRLALLRSTYVLQFDASSFYERVMACLLRYKAVFHPNGGTWQAAQPHGIFRLWADRCIFIVVAFDHEPLTDISLQAGSMH